MSDSAVLRARAPHGRRAPDQRLYDHICNELRSAIVTGRFSPGARIVERDLTEELRASRTPIREALRKLEQEGLVVGYPHRGYFVRDPSFEEAQQAYESRRVVEGACGELAAQRATEVEQAAIRASIVKARQVLESGDRLQLLLCNNEFHHLIVKAAHNEFLEKQWLVLWAFVDLLRGQWWGHTERPADGHFEHEALLDAIVRRDAALARRLNEEHVERAWANVAARFAQSANGRLA